MTHVQKKWIVFAAVGVLGAFLLTSRVWSHCEIPCGIYDDPMRISMMAEHIRTIEKSMNQIHELSAATDKNYNQLTRWIVNKGDHADQLSEIVTQYFMKQRIEPVGKEGGKAYEAYIHKLTLLHQLMVYSMKCKQTTDLDYVSKLRTTLAEFETAYFGKQVMSEGHSH